MEAYFSHSRLSTFAKCRKAFEFAYIKELPEAFQTIEKHLGTAVHETLEWTYKERIRGPLPALVELEECYRKIWCGLNIGSARIVKKNTCANGYFQEGWNLIKTHYARVVSVDLSETLHLEHEFEIDLDDRTRYRGIIDRISRQPDGLLRLTDYKTGRISDDPFKDQQLLSYTLFVFGQFPVNAVEIGCESLRSGFTHLKLVARTDTNPIRTDLLGRIGTVRSAVEFPATPSSLCPWCGYIDACPEGTSSLVRRNVPPLGVDPNECPACGSALRKRHGRNGPFLGCSAFPTCRYSRDC